MMEAQGCTACISPMLMSPAADSSSCFGLYFHEFPILSVEPGGKSEEPEGLSAATSSSIMLVM